jgi:ketosteroid isomerase-like protein
VFLPPDVYKQPYRLVLTWRASASGRFKVEDMENRKTCLFIFLLVFSSGALKAQNKEEVEIRRLEQLEAQAVVKGDTSTLFQKIWAPEFLVNNPANLVVNRQQVLTLIRSGKLDYEGFERIIERVSIIGNTAIVMGREVIKAKGVTDHAGKNVIRRYTNIWMQRDKQWKLVGRQATISSLTE